MSERVAVSVLANRVGLFVVDPAEALMKLDMLLMRTEVVAIGPRLANHPVLKRIDKLGCPVLILEVNVTVDPGNILPVRGKPRQADLEKAFLDPDMRATPDPDMMQPAAREVLILVRHIPRW